MYDPDAVPNKYTDGTLALPHSEKTRLWRRLWLCVMVFAVTLVQIFFTAEELQAAKNQAKTHIPTRAYWCQYAADWAKPYVCPQSASSTLPPAAAP